MPVMKNVISTLITGGGKITCKRCTAKSKRSGEQCKKPALRGKAVCEFHGGRSTGPKTEAGKARQRAAVLKTGAYTKAAMEDRARSVRVLVGLLDLVCRRHGPSLCSCPITDSPDLVNRLPCLGDSSFCGVDVFCPMVWVLA